MWHKTRSMRYTERIKLSGTLAHSSLHDARYLLITYISSNCSIYSFIWQYEVGTLQTFFIKSLLFLNQSNLDFIISSGTKSKWILFIIYIYIYIYIYYTMKMDIIRYYWTRVAVSICSDDNHYTMSTSTFFFYQNYW